MILLSHSEGKERFDVGLTYDDSTNEVLDLLTNGKARTSVSVFEKSKSKSVLAESVTKDVKEHSWFMTVDEEGAVIPPVQARIGRG